MANADWPDAQLRITSWFEGGAVVVRVAGEVDAATAPQLTEPLESAAARVTPPAPLVADLQKVSFFGSSGIHVLLKARELCRDRDVPLRIVAARPVTRPLTAMGMHHLLPVFPTLRSALDHEG